MSVHRSNKVKNLLRELDIPYVFNIPYSPDLNPIEFVFSKQKGAYRKYRTDAFINGYKFVPHEAIR